VRTADASPDERAVSIRIESARPSPEIPTDALRTVLAARATLPPADVSFAVADGDLVAGGSIATASLRATDAREAAAVAAALRHLTPASLEATLGFRATSIRGPVVHSPQEPVTAWPDPHDAPDDAATGSVVATPTARRVANPSRTGGLPMPTTPLLQLAAEFRHAGTLVALPAASATALASEEGEREEEAERRIASSRHAVTASEQLAVGDRAQPAERDGVLLAANFTIIEPAEPFDASAFASRLASLLRAKKRDVEAEAGSLPPPFPGASIVTAALLLPRRGTLALEPAHAASVLHSKREELDLQLAVTLLVEPTLSFALVSRNKVQLHALPSGGAAVAAAVDELPQTLIGPQRTAMPGDQAATGATGAVPVVRVAPHREVAGAVRDVAGETASAREAKGQPIAQERPQQPSAHEMVLEVRAPLHPAAETATPSVQPRTLAASAASPVSHASVTMDDATTADATAAEEAQLRIDLSVRGSLAAFDVPAMVVRLAALIGARADDIEVVSLQPNHAPRSSQRAALAAARATAKAAALVPEGGPPELTTTLHHIQEEVREAVESAEEDQRRPEGIDVRAMARVHRAGVRLASAALSVDASALSEGLGVQLLAPAALHVY